MLRFIGIVLFLTLGGWCFMLFDGDGNLFALGGCVLCGLLVLWLLFRAVFKKHRPTNGL